MLCSHRHCHCCCHRCHRSRCLCRHLYFCYHSVGCFLPPQCQYHCWRRRCLCRRHHRHDAAATAGTAAASVVATTTTMPLPLLAPLLSLAPPPLPQCHCNCWRCRCLLRRHYRHDATSVVDTARHGFAPSLLLIAVSKRVQTTRIWSSCGKSNYARTDPFYGNIVCG